MSAFRVKTSTSITASSGSLAAPPPLHPVRKRSIREKWENQRRAGGDQRCSGSPGKSRQSASGAFMCSSLLITFREQRPPLVSSSPHPFCPLYLLLSDLLSSSCFSVSHSGSSPLGSAGIRFAPVVLAAHLEQFRVGGRSEVRRSRGQEVKRSGGRPDVSKGQKCENPHKSDPASSRGSSPS